MSACAVEPPLMRVGTIKRKDDNLLMSEINKMKKIIAQQELRIKNLEAKLQSSKV